MELEPGVMEDKTKPMENEKWISDGLKVGDFERRTPPEQGEGPTSAEVVTCMLNTLTTTVHHINYHNLTLFKSVCSYVTKLVE